jgi:hypothetical protein
MCYNIIVPRGIHKIKKKVLSMFDVLVKLVGKTEYIRFYSEWAARLWVAEKEIWACVDVEKIYLINHITGELIQEWK